ncbi:MAG TPA: YceI family protein [Burkholderiales bacterium]|jgi:polyisoprenoid-binding protein YceI|nr:YceI family protein [Burkholderiales bacterium]
MKIQRILLLSTLLLPAIAQAGVDYARSRIEFTSRQMNVPVDGRFTRFTAQVAYDPKSPAQAKAEIEVELASVDTGSAEADLEVARKGWFNTAAFPRARFTSTSVRPLSADRLEVRGALAIKGLTREVIVPVTVKAAGNATTFEGAFPIMRLQFRIGEGVWSDTDTVADEVQVKFRIVTTK